MLQFGLRMGDPKQCITTTPRAIPIVKALLREAEDDENGVIITRGITTDNAANLAPKFLQKIKARYEGTRLGRQELKAEILDDVPGALWTRDMIEKTRVKKPQGKPPKLPKMVRIVVGIDPNITAPLDGVVLEDVAETGIIVAGMGDDGRGYVFEDLTCRLGPNGWARKAIAGYDEYGADAIVAEINQGGAMVTSVIKSVRTTINVIPVRASKGKVTRAEPIAALYEQGRVSHVGMFPELEDQMVLFTPFGIESDTTADRVDALVWALTQLFPSIVFRPIQDDELDDRSNEQGRSEHTGY